MLLHIWMMASSHPCMGMVTDLMQYANLHLMADDAASSGTGLVSLIEPARMRPPRPDHLGPIAGPLASVLFLCTKYGSLPSAMAASQFVEEWCV